MLNLPASILLLLVVLLFGQTRASGQLLSAFRACSESSTLLSETARIAQREASQKSSLGQFTAAREAVSSAIKTIETFFGSEHPDLPVLLLAQAELHLEFLEDLEAASSLRKALSSATKSCATNHLLLTGIRVALAGVEMRLLNVDSAVSTLTAATEFLRSQSSPHPESAALLSLGKAELGLSLDFTKEAATNLNVSRIFATDPIRDRLLAAEEALMRSGVILEPLGAYSSTLRGLILMKQAHHTNGVHYASAISQFGHALAALGKHKEAETVFRENLQAQVVLTGNFVNPRVAAIFGNLGALFCRTEPESDRAAGYLNQSFNIVHKHYGSFHQSSLALLHQLTRCAYRRGLFADSLDFAYSYHSITKRVFGEKSIQDAIARENYGYILYLKGEPKRAEAWLRNAAEDIFSKTEPWDIRRMNTFLPMIEVSLSLGDYRSALDYCWRRKCAEYVFRCETLRYSEELGQFLPDLTFQFTTDLAHNLAAIENPAMPWAGAKFAVLEKSAIGEFHTMKLDVERLERTLSGDPIKWTTAERSLIQKWQPFDLEDMAVQLPQHTALVDIVQFQRYDFTDRIGQQRESRFAAYITFPAQKIAGNPVVDPNGQPSFAVKRVDLGEAAPINAAVVELHQLFAERRIAPQRLEPVLQRLGALLYAPLARHLTNVAHLIVCPDGQLGRLPFELLPVDAKGRRLVEDKLITYVSSGREVARLAQPRATVATSAPLVMGNPDFELDLGKTTQTNRQGQPASSTNGVLAAFTDHRNATRSRDFSPHGFKFTTLPDSETEARKVAALLGKGAVVRLGASAREADLKAVVSPRVLHLATHGFFLTDQDFKRTNGLAENFLLGRQSFAPAGQDWENPLIRCGIALAGANRAAGITNALAEDGILTGLEAALLNLQGTELVILSACDSGSGDVTIGEGVMSLRRAFTIAGAETVLASHWKVNDAATSALMTEFMRRWQAGTPRGQALREAQLSLLRSKDFSNPYFWAAFTLTGQWR